MVFHTFTHPTGPQPDLLQVKVPEKKDAEDEEDNPLTKYFHSQL